MRFERWKAQYKFPLLLLLLLTSLNRRLGGMVTNAAKALPFIPRKKAPIVELCSEKL